MKSPVCFLRVLALVALALTARNAQAQSEPDSVHRSLYREIMTADSLVFEAFNKRDLKNFSGFFSADLEFYHDKGGLTGYDHTVDFLKTISKPGNDLQRELVKDNLEIYPIPGYGAMQIGSHRFCHTENSKRNCGKFRFVHIWQKMNGKWKITRVISYDH